MPVRAGAERWSRQLFQEAALAQRCCQMPGCSTPTGPWHSHHVIYEQELRKRGYARYDARNSLRLCVHCHAQHHRGKIVPLSALSDNNFEYAHEVLGSAAYDYLRRHYVGEDVRLEMMLR